MRNKRIESFLFGLYHLKSVIIASPWRIKACSVQRRTKTKTRDVESSVLQHLVWENSLSERHCVINLLFSATGRVHVEGGASVHEAWGSVFCIPSISLNT